MGQLVGIRVAFLGDLVHLPPAGIGDAHGPGSLVEGLSRGVVPGAAQNLQPGVVLHLNNVGMAPRHHQAQKRRLQIGIGQVVGGDVPPQMVHGDQGQPGGKGQPFGKVHPHQKGPDQPWGVGDGNAIDLGEGLAPLLQGLFHHAHNGLTVAAGGDLRHHTAVDLVLLHLGGHHGGKDGPAVLHQGGGGFVARAFNA